MNIITNGWGLIEVEPGEETTGEIGWTYTVGLMESFDHPELVIVGLPAGAAGAILNRFGEYIRSGGTMAEAERNGFTARVIDPAHVENGLVATWSRLYGRDADPGTFLQVIPPPHLAEGVPASEVPDLSDPAAVLTARPLNRAQRRARRRRAARWN